MVSKHNCNQGADKKFVTIAIKLQAYCKYTNIGSWREAALDEMMWKSHLDSFVDFCRM